MSENKLLSAENVYDRWAKQYENDIEEMRWNAPEKVFSGVSENLKDGMKVFEAGCGTGFLSRMFTKHANVTVHGTDISDGMIEKCVNHPDSKNIYVQKLDIEKQCLPFPDKDFDIAISCGVLEYLEDLTLTCKEISRILKKNGIVALAYESHPDNDPERTITKANSGSSGVVDGNEPVKGTFFYYHHSPQKIQKLFSDEGFETLKHFSFESTRFEKESVYYNLFLAQKKENESTHPEHLSPLQQEP